MKITQSRGSQVQAYGTDATESANKVSSQKTQEAGWVQTEKTTDTKRASQSEVSSKKAELEMAGQAQAAIYRKQLHKEGSAMRFGDEGEDVKMLQIMLNEYRRSKGMAPIKEDAKFGPETQKAVLQFQKERNLKKLDGMAGRETLGSLQLHGSERAEKPSEDKSEHILPPHPWVPKPLKPMPPPPTIVDEWEKIVGPGIRLAKKHVVDPLSEAVKEGVIDPMKKGIEELKKRLP